MQLILCITEKGAVNITTCHNKGNTVKVFESIYFSLFEFKLDLLKQEQEKLSVFYQYVASLVKHACSTNLE